MNNLSSVLNGVGQLWWAWLLLTCYFLWRGIGTIKAGDVRRGPHGEKVIETRSTTYLRFGVAGWMSLVLFVVSVVLRVVL